MAAIKIAVTLSLLRVASVLAIDLGAPLVGCSEVDCPTAVNSTSAECRVVDRTSTLIGLANFDSSVTDDDFTWTQGIQVYDDVGPKEHFDRMYEKSFYLGTPEGFDLVKDAASSDYDACALFFTKVTNLVTFDGENEETSVGTCNDALNSDCVNALLKQATDVAAGSASSTLGFCKALLSDFTNNLAAQCPQFATGDKWEGLAVRNLTGSAAPKPFTEAENFTSNCHPTLPKSNSLTRVAAFNTTGTAKVKSIKENIYSITPVLTVFNPRLKLNSGLLKHPEARLTCLKGVGETDAAIATKSQTDENKDSGAGLVLQVPKVVVPVLITVFSVWILV